MATIKKMAKGYQAQVCVKGVRKAASFRTKREAESWANTTEVELAEVGQDNHRTLADAMTRYRDEVASAKRGGRWDVIRIDAFLADKTFPSQKKMGALVPEDFTTWRDKRLAEVSSGSVLRDFSTISPILELARREWKWLSTNPLKDVRKPREPDHREVTIETRQIRRMLRVMRYKRGACKGSTQAVCVAFLLALRTGMRAGEICALKWADVFPGYVRVTGDEIGGGKTRAAKRDVPLVYQAERLIQSMQGWDAEYVFGIKSATLDALFRRYRDRANLEGFTFHDARHTAATRISKKVDVLSLCKIFGWKNTKQALTYYNPKASDLRKMLEPKRA